MNGYVKTSGVKDIYYTYMKINHLFKDDYLDVSYSGKIKVEKCQYGTERTSDYDFTVCGWGIIPILLAIEKYSPEVDTSEVRRKIQEKFEWWKENEKEDYKRNFGEEKVYDIVRYYQERHP